ncbi:RND family efflux transporter, MFP subunit [Xenococcus sp. PCC 7305]|uniref:efflux RND transporter periplasmic adaptor subunit n=1 Tax=Xenococcus sp. PCC 7305 TaxID=102125 RepID=UPI0002ABE998|nr:efflux RND transporter periplasmic adaptor subunit [Xenococcus sp. PCC 7305]ELS03396.1 RND family efflux transporter, MFP subunit [Xenococcus sp. PCC 7305]
MNHNKTVAKQYSVTKYQQKLRRFSANKSLLIGVGLGLLLSWVGAKFTAPVATKDSSTKPQAKAIAADVSNASARYVTTTEVASNQVARSLKASGTVEAYELIPVMSQATGLQIQEILVDEGDSVKKGQILAKLKSNALEAEYLQAQGSLAQAEARLAEIEAGTRFEEIARAEERVRSLAAEVARAESDMDLVTKRVERNETLETEGAISRDRLDEIYNQERINKATLEQAQARLAEGKQELAQLKSGERPEVILAVQAELLQAQGRLQLIETQLQDATVTAPASGIIAERDARLGDLTSNSDNLFTIIENGRLELRLEVPETSISQIKPRQKVQIVSQYNSQPLIGMVREIDPIIDPQSRQATVNIDLPSDAPLKPGMFLRATVNVATTQGKTVPVKALLPQADGSAIAFVVQDNNTVKAQAVEIGEILANEKVEVFRGLQTGDRIVVKGAAYLKDGDAVNFELIN